MKIICRSCKRPKEKDLKAGFCLICWLNNYRFYAPDYKPFFFGKTAYLMGLQK